MLCGGDGERLYGQHSGLDEVESLDQFWSILNRLGCFVSKPVGKQGIERRCQVLELMDKGRAKVQQTQK